MYEELYESIDKLGKVSGQSTLCEAVKSLIHVCLESYLDHSEIKIGAETNKQDVLNMGMKDGAVIVEQYQDVQDNPFKNKLIPQSELDKFYMEQKQREEASPQEKYNYESYFIQLLPAYKEAMEFRKRLAAIDNSNSSSSLPTTYLTGLNKSLRVLGSVRIK